MPRNSATASAPGPGAITVVRANSREPSLSTTTNGTPRWSWVTTCTRTGTTRPAWAAEGDSMSVTARSRTCVDPVRNVCTGNPSERAASTGSTPTLLAPSLITTTPPSASAWGASFSPASASPSAVSAGLPVCSVSAATRSANGTVRMRPRPRHDRLNSATARSAAVARETPPGTTGSCMLSERSSNTSRLELPEWARSNTGWASNNTIKASPRPRSSGRRRRAALGSGGMVKR